MESFGQKLRQAVESQGLRLDEVARATGLRADQIEALGRDDFDALPDDETLREGLRSFARLLDVDPDEVFEDYRKERLRRHEAAPALEDVEVEQEEHDESDWTEPPPDRTHGWTAFATLALALQALAAIVFLSWPRSQTSPPPTGRPVPIVQAPAPVTETAPPPARASLSMKPASAMARPIPASGLSIRDQGVGRDVIDHELVGETDRFTEGERVSFWTRIEGGAEGQTIDHVWIHEGDEALRVALTLGGARWRTHSHKALLSGSAGRWAVEARDETGRVLARREFQVTALPGEVAARSEE